MSRAYGNDLRERVLNAADAGASARSVAARFGIGVVTAIVWIRRARETGERTARRQGQPGGSRLDAHEAFIVSMIETTKDITLNEMVARLREDLGVVISRSGLSIWLRGRGWTFKNFPQSLQAHLSHLPADTPIEIWFQCMVRLRFARRNDRPD